MCFGDSRLFAVTGVDRLTNRATREERKRGRVRTILPATERALNGRCNRSSAQGACFGGVVGRSVRRKKPIRCTAVGLALGSPYNTCGNVLLIYNNLHLSNGKALDHHRLALDYRELYLSRKLCIIIPIAVFQENCCWLVGWLVVSQLSSCALDRSRDVTSKQPKGR